MTSLFTIKDGTLEKILAETNSYMMRFHEWYFNQFLIDQKKDGVIVRGDLFPNAIKIAKKIDSYPRHTGQKFDQIMRFNAAETIRATINYLDYYFIKDGVHSIDELMERLYGMTFKSHFLESLRKFDYTARLKMIRLEQKNSESKTERIRYLTPVARIVFGEFLEYLNKNLSLPPGVKQRFNAQTLNVTVEDTGDGFSFMSNDEQKITVDPDDGMFVYKHDDGFVVNAAGLMHIFFHEVAGHYLRRPYSANLPSNVQGLDMNYGFASACHDEAYAMVNEKKAIKYLQENPELKFFLDKDGNILSRERLNNEDLWYEETKIKTWENKNNFFKYFMWLTTRLEEDKDYNYSRDISAMARKKLPPEMLEHMVFHPANYMQDPLAYKEQILERGILKVTDWFELPLLASYRKGVLMQKSVRRYIKRRYGKDGLDSVELPDILWTGCWSHRAFPAFVDYAMSHPKEFYEMLN
jgi:hypothetical protein